MEASALNSPLDNSLANDASSSPSGELFARVLFKPDGVSRILSASEADAVVATWNSLLDALTTLPASGVSMSGLASELPQIIAGRQGYRTGYDLEVWRSQARSCRRSPTAGGPVGVRDLHARIFNSLDLRQLSQVRDDLSAAEVEAIYGPSQWFAEDPAALTSYMLSGPVIKELWCGSNIELALLVKFAVRQALGIEGRYNLVHCDLIPASPGGEA